MAPKRRPGQVAPAGGSRPRTRTRSADAARSSLRRAHEHPFCRGGGVVREPYARERDDELTWQEAGAWPNTFRKARFLSAIDHIQLDRLRRLVMQVMDEAFRGSRSMIGPALAGPMLVITNFTGHPASSCVPVSANRRRGARCHWRTAGSNRAARRRAPSTYIPHGICLWGRLFDEGNMLEIGGALERGWRWRRRPPSADCRSGS